LRKFNFWGCVLGGWESSKFCPSKKAKLTIYRFLMIPTFTMKMTIVLQGLSKYNAQRVAEFCDNFLPVTIFCRYIMSYCVLIMFPSMLLFPGVLGFE
jgi:hypothetical protein